MTAKTKALQDFVRVAINGYAPLTYTREFATLCKHWQAELAQTVPLLPDTLDMSDIEKAREALVEYQNKVFAEIQERRQKLRAEIEKLSNAKKAFDKEFTSVFKP